MAHPFSEMLHSHLKKYRSCEIEIIQYLQCHPIFVEKEVFICKVWKDIHWNINNRYLWTMWYYEVFLLFLHTS